MDKIQNLQKLQHISVFWSLNENIMISSIESSTEIEHKLRDPSTISSHNKVICNLH